MREYYLEIVADQKIFIRVVRVNTEQGGKLPQQKGCLWYCIIETDEE